MALTETALKALKPRDKPFTKADERGLYIEVFPTGGVIWRFRYRLNGKQEKLTPEQFKAWSQNLGHEGVLTTFLSYGTVEQRRQGEIIKVLSGPRDALVPNINADVLARAVLKAMREAGPA